MALRTAVKVGKITNLSDARYCAGMGVDMLGFRVDENDKDYIKPEIFQEIRGWFSGPQVVAECEGITSADLLKDIETKYQPDLVELSLRQIDLADNSNLPIIVNIDRDTELTELVKLEKYRNRIRYVIIPETAAALLVHIPSAYPVLLAIHDAAGVSKLQLSIIKGVSLDGTAEERPGLKDYALLAEVLELLEEE